jgi:anti-sigma regulatory factor (Ser/Thr protein kinase)
VSIEPVQVWIDLTTDDEDAPQRVREHVRDVLTEYPSALVDDAVLVASELVSNANRHGDGVRWLEVRADLGMVHIAVADRSPGPPAATGDGEHEGFGLRIVGAASAQWSFHRDGDGKVVWARL